ncbi:MAG: ABC transporter permease [Planctomycetota bacterium]
MIGAVRIAAAHARHRWGRSLVVCACLTLTIALPLVSRAMTSAFDRELRARAEGVPLVVGAKGSRFGLVFNALHFRRSDLDTVPLGLYDELLNDTTVRAVPMHARFTAQRVPIAATSIEYFDERGLIVAEGRPFATLGDCVVGASAARSLRVAPDSTIRSDQARGLDITAAPSIEMRVVGVLAPTGSPDDNAIFVDLETAWLLEGRSHGHDDADTIDREGEVIGRTEDFVSLSGAVVERQVVTLENARDFHLHGDRETLPLTSILVFPEDDRAQTILATRLNAGDGYQAVQPTQVIDDLVASVVRIRVIFDGLAVVLGVVVLLLVGLIVLLGIRVRADEIATMMEIGASRATVAAVIGSELVVLALVAAVLAVGAAAVAGMLASGLLLQLAT